MMTCSEDLNQELNPMFGVTLAGSIALTDWLSGRLKSRVNSPIVSAAGSGKFGWGIVY